jgi:eukaryotic-like serine/threonine-protein kinase
MSSARAWILLIVVCSILASIAALAQRGAAGQNTQLVLVDKEGHRTPVGPLPLATFAPRISPDGQEIVFDTQDDGSVWIAKLSDVAAKRRLTTEGSNRGPIWSGDGKHILYITDDQGQETLFWRLADGTGRPEILVKPARAPESWNPREPGLSYITLNPGGDYDVWIYSFADKQSVAFAKIPGSPQHSSHYSPDGRWIAYVSAETGRLEVYVRPTVGSAAAIQVSKSGGGHPLWSPDQKELYFDNGGQMFAVAISTEPSFSAATPASLPITGFIQGPLRRQYDLMPDGKHFLMMFQPGR